MCHIRHALKASVGVFVFPLLLVPVCNLFIHGPGFPGRTPLRQILPENLEKRQPQKKERWRSEAGVAFNFIAAIVALNVCWLVSEAELMCARAINPSGFDVILLLLARRLTRVEVDDMNNQAQHLTAANVLANIRRIKRVE